MKQKLLFVLIFSFQFTLLAQEDAWVYFTDKENVAASIDNPISILTQKAIDRKTAHNVAVDERDVPVNETYISTLKNQTGITVLAKSKWFNTVHIRGLETDISALISLSFVDQIIFANKNLDALRVRSTSNKYETEDELTNFDYGNSANQIEMINGDDLHIDGFTGAGMTIAVIDAGFPNVDTMGGFQRLRDQGGILGGYDFFDRTSDVYINTTSSHGTMVLSDMAGYIENQFVGTAPDASYYLFRTENAPNENPLEESLWVEAAERADSLGVDIINTSLGYKDYDNTSYSHTSADLDGNTTYITKGANIAFEKGMLLVNSAGNSGSSGVGAPADAVGVFSIGAVKSDGTYASFSSVGSAIQPTQKPDVVAQGQSSAIINSNNAVTSANGTSFSSPIMAGGMACLWQALPSLSNAEIMQLVRESASQYTSPDYFLGYGIPNLAIAYTLGLQISEDIEEGVTELKVYPNPASNVLNIEIPSLEETTEISIYTILGKRIYFKSSTSETEQIDISAFSNGVYMLNVSDATHTSTLKIVKK